MQHQRVTGPVDEFLDEGGLADTRFAADHQAAGRPVPCPIEELGQMCALPLAPD
jgi:hypothetical protein